MTRRSILLLWVAAPVRPSPSQSDLALITHQQYSDLLAFKEKWDHWTTQLLKGINDYHAGKALVKQWGAVRRWLPGD